MKNILHFFSLPKWYLLYFLHLTSAGRIGMYQDKVECYFVSNETIEEICNFYSFLVKHSNGLHVKIKSRTNCLVTELNDMMM